MKSHLLPDISASGKSITKEDVGRLISAVEPTYFTCWDTLELLGQRGSADAEIAQRIIDFQPPLADALYQIEHLKQRIHRDRRLLIGRKQSLNASWFSRSMKATASMLEQLDDLAGLGRRLGDAYAWWFYSQSRDLLERHFEHPRTDQSPPGVGGLGEVIFISSIRHFEGNFVLFHGITTFLRVGDVSLIDLKAMRVVAIGELKSHKVSESQYDITFFASGTGEMTPRKSERVRAKKSSHLPLHIERKLSKQLIKASECFDERKASGNAEIHMDSHFEQFENLLAEVRVGQPAKWGKLGKGLLLAVSKRKSKRLSARYSAPSKKVLERMYSELTDHVLMIMDKENVGDDNFNSIHLTPLEPTVGRGRIPMFWWPISKSLLKDVYFGRAWIMAIYNPSFLAHALKRDGWTIETTNDGGFRLSRQWNDRKVEMHHMEFFQHCIVHQLSSEAFVVEALAAVFSEIEQGRFPVNSKINIALRHVFGSPGDTGFR